MIDEVLSTIKENNMFNVGDKVIVAVSGGPDSISLLHILYTLREKLGISLVVTHVNHCLRDKEADEDEDYVRNFCKRLDIECYVKRSDVHKISVEKGISTETAGREVRYDFFQEVLKKTHGNKIALAHNCNDQAETVIMRIFRGTGLEGLSGIRPVRDNIYVRPLINIERGKIEYYCRENKLNPRIDKTNLENIYTRNKIRLELIPYIEKNFNPDIIQSINRLSHTIENDDNYIKAVASKIFDKSCELKNGKVIIRSEAFKEHNAILTRIIRMALKKVVGSLYNFDKKHIYDVITLQEGTTGKTIMLPSGVRARNNYEDVQLYLNEVSTEKDTSEYTLVLNYENNLPLIGLNISLRVINSKEKVNFKEGELIKYFDYDKIKKDVKLRYRKDGDRFTPLGMKESKKLKDFFINLKVPKEKRDRIPLILFNDEIAWIVGYRISDKFKIDEFTKNILQIKIRQEGEV